MNAIGEIFAALLILFASGYGMEKIYVAVKREAIIKVHRGLPSLSAYTNKLTCSKISENGSLIPAKCSHHGLKREPYEARK